MIFEHVLWLEIFIYYELSAARLQPSTGRCQITRVDLILQISVILVILYLSVEDCSLGTESS